MWIAALVDYRKAKATIAPYQEKLKQAKDTLLEAQSVYVSMRQAMMETKDALEETVQQKKEAVKHAKAIEAEVDEVQSQVDTLQHLLHSIAVQKEKWEKQLEDAQECLRCLPASSLLVAAAATYSSCLPMNKHQELWMNWMGYCKGERSLGSLQTSSTLSQFVHNDNKPSIQIQEGFTLKQALASKDELVKWKQDNLFPHSIILEKCLLLRAQQRFGKAQVHIVFDPHHQFKKYLTIFNTADNEQQLSENQEDIQHVESVTTIFLSKLTNFDPLLESLMTKCTTVLVINSIKRILEVMKVLLPLLQSHPKDSEVEIDPETHLFLILHASLSDSQGMTPLTILFQALASFHIINLELDQQALCNLVHHSMLEYIRHDLCVQQRALLADLRLQMQVAQECQGSILNEVLSTEWKKEQEQEHCASLIEFVNKIKGEVKATDEQIYETKRALKSIDAQSEQYRVLSRHTTAIQLSCQKLSDKLPHAGIELQILLQMLRTVLQCHENIHFHNSQSALRAYLQYAKDTLSIQVQEVSSLALFSEQQILLPLLISLQTEILDGRVTESEYQMFMAPTKLSMEQLLDNILNKTSPTWMDNYMLCRVKAFQELPGLETLPHSFLSFSILWEEYFSERPSLLDPTPFHTEPSNFQKLLIWKAIRPDMLHKAVENYVLLCFGDSLPLKKHFDPVSLAEVSQQQAILLLTRTTESPVAELLVAAASQKCVPLHVLSAVSERECLVEAVERLSNDSCWVLIEHIPLIHKWQDEVENICQMLATSSSDSHHCLWITVPVEYIPDLMTPLRDMGKGLLPVAFPDSHVLTMDTKFVIPSTLPPSTDAYCGNSNLKSLNTVVRQLQHLLPEPIQYGHQDKAETGTLNLVLTAEAVSFNNMIGFIQCCLDHCVACLQGKLFLNASVCKLLSLLMCNSVPVEWARMFGLSSPDLANFRLTTLMQLLQKRRVFLGNCLEESTIPRVIDPCLLFRPSAVTILLRQNTVDQVVAAQIVPELPKKKAQDILFQGIYVEQDRSSHGPYYLSFITTRIDQELEEVPLLLRIDGCKVDIGMSVKLLTEQGGVLQTYSSSISMLYNFQF